MVNDMGMMNSTQTVLDEKAIIASAEKALADIAAIRTWYRPWRGKHRDTL